MRSVAQVLTERLLSAKVAARRLLVELACRSRSRSSTVLPSDLTLALMERWDFARLLCVPLQFEIICQAAQEMGWISPVFI